MQKELMERCNAQADAELNGIMEAWEKEELEEYLSEYVDSTEVKCSISGEMTDFEIILCGGGPTGTLSYDKIEVSWGGDHFARRTLPQEVANAIWDYIENEFNTLTFNRMFSQKSKRCF